MIECVNGKDISAYSSLNKEEEVILMSGTTLVAMDDSLIVNDIRVVHLKEVETTASPSGRWSRAFIRNDLFAAQKSKIPFLSYKPMLSTGAALPPIKHPPKSLKPYKKYWVSVFVIRTSFEKKL